MPAQTQEKPELVNNHLEAGVPAEPTREIPKWALIVGLIAFLVFNGLFLIFAMSIGNGTPN